jgi:signal transduction histidine kinase/CheY-like chemotaxis protein
MRNRTSKRKETLAQVLPIRREPAKPRRRLRLAPLEHSETERAIAAMAACISEAATAAGAQQSQLSIIHGLLKARSCFLAYHVPGRDELHVEHVRGRYDKRIAVARPGYGPIGRAFSEGRVVRDSGLIAVPMLSRDIAFGCLAILSPQKEPSDELLAALAAQVAAASEVARLRDEAMRRNKDLQTAVAGLKSLESNRESLLSNVSHDLKTPLTTIKVYLNLLEKQKLGPLTERQSKAVAVCERNAERLLRMINDLLLISRLQSGKMQLHERPFGLKALAEEVVQALASESERASVRVLIPPCSEVYVRGDRHRISEAAFNLVENAIHHSQPQSAVEVTISSIESGMAVLSVADRGPGIAEADLEHIFDRYHRPKPGAPRSRHRGLGLPLVAKIAQLHGGRVEVSSNLGEGSIFQLSLPLFAAAVSPARDAPAPAPGGILLVEDDADCREVLAQVLEDAGYAVESTSTAAEALALLGHIRPAMVLLDLRLSDGDGRSVLHFIRETPSLANLAVYIISGASEVGSLVGGKGKDRIDGLFEKPLPLPKLLDTVASTVHPNRPAQTRSR